MTTAMTNGYLPGEVLTGRMTALEWLERFAPGVLEIMNDMGAADQGVAEITERGHETAQRLNLPHSPEGYYPPVVWELESA
jgi:hypothetical protein